MTVIEFLSSIKSLQNFYDNKIFCAALFRLLDSENSLIFTLLGNNISLKTLKESFTKAQPSKPLKDILGTLVSLNLIKRSNGVLILNEKFRQTLLKGFCENLDLFFIKTVLICDVEDICNVKFIAVLESIINFKVIKRVTDILMFSGLLTSVGSITNQGFEFLLMSKKDQLWFLILQSLKYYHDDNLILPMMELVLKRRFQVFNTNPFNLKWLIFLDSIGVLVIKDQTGTSLSVVSNTSVLFDSPNSDQVNKYLILETNFKIYAFPSQSYEKSILFLFCKTETVFPNMIKATLDEECIMTAFNKGITANQIIKYLQDHSSVIPKNVINQILIWEKKQRRIKTHNGYLYHDFLHLSDYQKILKLLESKSSLIFKDEEKRILIGKEDTHEEVKELLKILK